MKYQPHKPICRCKLALLTFPGIDGGIRIGVQPVIPAQEIADPDVDHLGVMAYAAWFQYSTPNQVGCDDATVS